MQDREAEAHEAEDRVGLLVRDTMRAELGGMFEDLRRFVDRRIAELSVEVSATVQLMDFSEANLSGQLASMREQIAGLVAAPALAARNSGVELEAVVQATEEAANRIMEAAEAIEIWVRDGQDSPAALRSVSEKIAAIFEACSFQDLTSQRIRRAIEHLQVVETMLGRLVPPQAGQERAVLDGAADPDMAQDAVDRLLGL